MAIVQHIYRGYNIFTRPETEDGPNRWFFTGYDGEERGPFNTDEDAMNSVDILKRELFQEQKKQMGLGDDDSTD